jgi:hypothetical protein
MVYFKIYTCIVCHVTVIEAHGAGRAHLVNRYPRRSQYPKCGYTGPGTVTLEINVLELHCACHWVTVAPSPNRFYFIQLQPLRGLSSPSDK